MLTGSTELGRISKIYHNNGNGTFSEQTSLIGVSESSASWSDYDNDGYLDILLAGSTASGAPISKIYHNNGNNTFIEQTSINLPGIQYGSAIWGDYDNDGYPDFLLAGNTGSEDISKIYHNNGDGSFEEQSSIPLTGISDGSAVWGDYDNDGYLDILLTGSTSNSKIYHNNGNNSFTEQTSIILYDLYNSSAAWGDYDNDRDMDFLICGKVPSGMFNLSSEVYRNNNIIPNTTPSIPSNLKTAVYGNEVTFSWDKSTDNETSQNGLTYNLVIGTSADACNILSPMSDRNTGRRRIVNSGNAGHNNSWTIKNLPDGQYYWSVQAIDNNFAGSQFALEKTFTILKTPVYVKVFLQGPYAGNGTMNTTLKANNLLPTAQPYNNSPWSYSGTESVPSVPDGVVDWVLVELRSDINTVFQTRSAFLMSDGSIHDIDGSDHVNFNGISDGNYYIVIKHRNHLSVMSVNAVPLPNSPETTYDFTTGSDKYYGTINGAKQLGTGVWGMIAGDVDGSGDFGPFDLINVRSGIVNGETGYLSKDVDLSGDMGPFDLIRVREGIINGYSSAVPQF